MTTYELKHYRRELEHAISHGNLDERQRTQVKLDAVLVEQEERVKALEEISSSEI